MQTKHHLDMPMRIKSVGDDGTFSGYGSVFGVEDSYGDVVMKGAFDASLADWKAKSMMPALLWQHDTTEPIGVYTLMREDDHGLYVEGRLLIDDDPLAKRAHAHLKAGSLSGMSIGYNLPEDGWRYDSEKGVFIIEKLNLWEVSLVTFPANDEARVQRVKAALSAGAIPKPSEVERLLRDAGFSRQQAKAVMAKGYTGIDQREADNSGELESAKKLIQSLRGQ